MPPMRLFALAALLAACSAPPTVSDTTIDDPTILRAPGGLSAAQTDDLRALGVPVLVPGTPGAFEVTDVAVERRGRVARWAVDYRRSDGACFEVSGGNDGARVPDLPLVSTEVYVGDLGRRVRVYQAADVPGATSAQVWGLNTVVSEPIQLDGGTALVLSDTQGGCRPVTIEEGARVVSDLILLAPGFSTAPTGVAPAPDASPDLGAFAPADDVLDGRNAASTPGLAADAVARRYSDDAGRVSVEVLSERSYEATALVTLYDLRDDSVRDERLRLVYTPVGDAWELVDAGRQVRCQPGRGHQDWSPAACA